MKKLLFILLGFQWVFFLLSCKKEISCDDCIENNKPPNAVAGPDQVITLPTDSISLDGSSSGDPDGTISEWRWAKISGPASFNIGNASLSKTVVKNIVAGTYQFELKVTDDKGTSARDTMQVIVDTIVTGNHSPVANAGPHQTIILPTNTVTLDGSASSDPDNNITTYLWTKISGPSSYITIYPNSVQTQVINLQQGVYQFELKVTDFFGLSSTDTMQVTVNSQLPPCDMTGRPIIDATLAMNGILSEPRAPLAGAAGNKVVFAGGFKFFQPSAFYCNEVDMGSSTVDIYDVISHTWSTTQLSKPRLSMGVASNGNKILFAGGYSWEEGSPLSLHVSYDNVDIYNVSTDTWEVTHLSKARQSMAAVTIGNKILFAGGSFFTGNPFSNLVWDISNVVDIYDLSTNSWSSTTLSVARADINAVVVGDKIYFIGGYSYGPGPMNTVDIYNNTTNTWSVSDLQTVIASLSPPPGMGVIDRFDVAGDNVIFWSGQNQAGVRNLTTGATSIACVSHRTPVFFINNSIVFFDGSSQFDIYNTSTGVWSVGVSNPAIPAELYPCFISLNNVIYLGGGWENINACDYADKVYKLTW